MEAIADIPFTFVMNVVAVVLNPDDEKKRTQNLFTVSTR